MFFWPRGTGFRNIRVELLGRFHGARLKVPHLPMLTLACMVHAHWCFHGNSLKLASLPHRAERDSAVQSCFVTPKQDYNAFETSLFTHTYRQKNTRIKLLQNNNAC